MPPKGVKKPKPKPVAPKDVIIYLAEVDEDGIVPENSVTIVRQCVTDKIFAESQDHIALVRTDMTSNVELDPANWPTLKKVEQKFRQRGTSSSDESDPISALIDMCNVIATQAEEDSYEHKKMLFFGLLKTDLKEDKLKELATVVNTNEIHLCMILPDQQGMDDRQVENCKSVRKLFECQHYEDWVYVCTQSEAKKQIFNTMSKETKRAMPWNVNLEIGSNLEISVSGFVCTRKNVASAIKKALLIKEEEHLLESGNGHGAFGIHSSATPGMDEDGDVEPERKTVVVEFASKVTEKETTWKEKNGDIVLEEDLGKGYFYGDKLIPYNELEKQEAYKSGEKCFRVILFCPRGLIKSWFLQGDGTTLFYAKKGDSLSEVKLSALRQALHNNDRVAIVRKVFRRDTRVVVGILSPDMDRKCLVFSELCFADDVSVPHFASLFKQELLEDDDYGTTISAKEQFMDDLILSQPLDGFHPFEGPIDPNAANIRRNIASRILDPDSQTKPKAEIEPDNIDTFFDKVVVRQLALEGLRDAFPLKPNKEVTERPAGANIFRKRRLDGNEESQDLDAEVEKKVKVEDMDVDAGSQNIVTAGGPAANDDVDYDDLLGQL